MKTAMPVFRFYRNNCLDDEDGNLVDVRLSEKPNTEAAKAFFAQAHEVVQRALLSSDDHGLV